MTPDRSTDQVVPVTVARPANNADSPLKRFALTVVPASVVPVIVVGKVLVGDVIPSMDADGATVSSVNVTSDEIPVLPAASIASAPAV